MQGFHLKNVVDVAVKISVWRGRVVQTLDDHVLSVHVSNCVVNGEVNCIRENAIAAIAFGHYYARCIIKPGSCKNNQRLLDVRHHTREG